MYNARGAPVLNRAGANKRRMRDESLPTDRSRGHELVSTVSRLDARLSSLSLPLSLVVVRGDDNNKEV